MEALGFRSIHEVAMARAIFATLSFLVVFGTSRLTLAEETASERVAIRIRYPADEPIRFEGHARMALSCRFGDDPDAQPTKFELGHRFLFEERAIRFEGEEVVEKTRFYERWEEALRMNAIDLGDPEGAFLNGRRLRFTRREDSSIEIGADDGGPISDSKRRSLAVHFDYLRFPLPDRPVAIGETWEVDGESLLPASSLSEKFRVRGATFHCRLASIDSMGESEESRVARIAFEGEVEGQLVGFHLLAVRGRVEGILLHDLAGDRPIRMDLRGPLEGKALEVGGEAPRKIAAEGEIEFVAAGVETEPRDE